MSTPTRVTDGEREAPAEAFAQQEHASGDGEHRRVATMSVVSTEPISSMNEVEAHGEWRASSTPASAASSPAAARRPLSRWP